MAFQKWRSGRVNLAKKPWAMRKDGDLWEQVDASLSGVLATAFTVKHIKGHPTPVMAQARVISPPHRVGNHAADRIADKGAQSHPLETKQALDVLH
eukprot:12759930-Alexandrium_andersonii.AAC.1